VTEAGLSIHQGVKMAEEQQQPVFNIEKLYVKDLSLEVPNAPAIYLEREAPQIDVNMSTESRALGEDMYHTSITVTVTAKIGDKTMFLVECTKAASSASRTCRRTRFRWCLASAAPTSSSRICARQCPMS
jgi:protein-export chaperone SecB